MVMAGAYAWALAYAPTFFAADGFSVLIPAAYCPMVIVSRIILLYLIIFPN